MKEEKKMSRHKMKKTIRKKAIGGHGTLIFLVLLGSFDRPTMLSKFWGKNHKNC